MTTETLSQEVSRHAGWSIFMGFLTAAVGAVMIIYPLATAAASTVFFGRRSSSPRSRSSSSRSPRTPPGSSFSSSCSASSTASPGRASIALPGLGVVTLTAVLGAMLIADAVIETVLGFSVPRGPAEAGSSSAASAACSSAF